MEKVKIRIIFICLAVVIVIATFFSVRIAVADTNNLDNSEILVDNIGIESVNKVAYWDEGQFNTGNIEIVANSNGKKLGDPPKILFISSLCSAHSLTKETVIQAINKCATVGQVDYFLFNGYTPSPWTEGYPPEDVTGTINKGQELPAEVCDSISTVFMEDNHRSLGKFIDCICNNVSSEKNYDYIFLEFDRTVLAHSYGNDEGTGWPENWTAKHSLSEVAALMIPYYKEQRVGWLVNRPHADSLLDPDEDQNGYTPTYVFYRGDGRQTLDATQYSALLSILYPTHYVSPELVMYTEGKNPHQIFYDETDKVVDFIVESIYSAVEYTLDFNDTVNAGVDIDEGSIKFLLSDDGTNWSEADISKNPYTITYDSSKRTISASISKLTFNKYVKLILPFSTETEKVGFKELSEDGKPNNGKAKVTMKIIAEDPTIKTNEIDPVLNWPVKITYECNNSDFGDVVNYVDDIMTDTPYSDSSFLGSFPKAAPGCDFIKWTKDSPSGIDVTMNNYNKSQYPMQNAYNRNFPAKYIANFEDKVTVFKDVENPGNFDGGNHATYNEGDYIKYKIIIKNSSLSIINDGLAADKLDTSFFDISDKSKIFISDGGVIDDNGVIKWENLTVPILDSGVPGEKLLYCEAPLKNVISTDIASKKLINNGLFGRDCG